MGGTCSTNGVKRKIINKRKLLVHVCETVAVILVYTAFGLLGRSVFLLTLRFSLQESILKMRLCHLFCSAGFSRLEHIRVCNASLIAY
jgi:hypothetical protein